MVACLGSPVSCPWGRTCGRGFGGCALWRSVDTCHVRLPFPVRVGGNGRWLLQRCFVVRPDEVRVNLVTPLWCRPSFVLTWPPMCPTSGESASGSPCHYLRCGSDRAGLTARPWWPCNGCYGQWEGKPSQTLPVARLSRGGPTGDYATPAPPLGVLQANGRPAPSDGRSAVLRMAFRTRRLSPPSCHGVAVRLHRLSRIPPAPWSAVPVAGRLSPCSNYPLT